MFLRTKNIFEVKFCSWHVDCDLLGTLIYIIDAHYFARFFSMVLEKNEEISAAELVFFTLFIKELDFTSFLDASSVEFTFVKSGF